MKNSRWMVIVALFAWHTTASSWGDEGHRITGYIANALLTANTRQKLRDLVGTDDLSQLSTILDDQRPEWETRFPGSSKWHYENRTICTASTVKPPCVRDQCITAQIERFIRALQHSQAKRSERSDAIYALAHLIGDLHQPLHLADNNDRGGNDLWVRLPHESEPRDLHAVWDTLLVRMNVHRRSRTRYAKDLLKNFEAQQSFWLQGNVQSWAQETYLLGKSYAYEALPHFACGVRHGNVVALTDDYVKHARRIVEEQLTKSGLRLALVLNKALGGER
ncbi:MAG: hypothetical protein H7Y02_03760 [Candidatus Obscuribacterales bacterium]|nr:hypothetical protein [Steroidobacteraceae bacterium]